MEPFRRRGQTIYPQGVTQQCQETQENQNIVLTSIVHPMTSKPENWWGEEYMKVNSRMYGVVLVMNRYRIWEIIWIELRSWKRNLFFFKERRETPVSPRADNDKISPSVPHNFIQYSILVRVTGSPSAQLKERDLQLEEELDADTTAHAEEQRPEPVRRERSVRRQSKRPSRNADFVFR